MAKKTYSAPKLTAHGTVVEETLGIGACCCEHSWYKAEDQPVES